MTAADPVRTKLREAKYHLERLAEIDKMKEFYPTVNAFLSAARSVLYLARHELGWKDRHAPQRVGIKPNEVSERQRFDQWCDSCPEAMAVLAHPLAEDRHAVIHRSGQAGFLHIPKSPSGLAISEGNAHGPGLVVRSGRAGLPLEDANVFRYRDAAGQEHDAVAYCRKYLNLVEQFFAEIQRGAWR
jgi:hypothetical protein